MGKLVAILLSVYFRVNQHPVDKIEIEEYGLIHIICIIITYLAIHIFHTYLTIYIIYISKQYII